ncbi:MAG: DUF6542 domain-containing protein [Corynebacterium casei]|uniref:DUF6542 domain-containing protein n=2 Tax=Corynebacterium casei TaxID=160386 RepID=G7HYS2_9CORY|nr:DMT family transporter [Corynebacterium casei]AHI20460.1 hypothetical protein CCASEI_09515 [Corynebacterium casei LMG S-19264]MDN5706005.1 hypothetical protein [Corynebacterium casei]MDN6274212.1 hypothetical protein [Corynebacterium casei]MDN6341203.1 hypothetical protein [Corynebacterium casei]CCE55337.1 putative uncharacterized protein [Corynebacterium casei UCMA 3821]
MSHVNTQSHPVSSRAEKGFGALPVWTSIAVIVAALATGLIISTITTSVGWPFLICFILGAVAASALVNVRGLFLTVGSIPLLFGIAIFFTSWLVSRASASEGSPAFSTTILVTSAYPLLEVFPYLAFTLLACIAIAIFRVYRAKQTVTSINSKEQVSRRAMAESDRRNRETTSRARQTTERLSVAELVERNKKSSRAPRPEPRRGSTSETPGAAAGASGAAGIAGGSAAARPSRRSSSARRGTAGDVRRVPRTDESRRGGSRTTSGRDESARGTGSPSRSARRVTDAQRSQERARRTQSVESPHATDDSVNAAGTQSPRRPASRRPDPLRRAGDVRRPLQGGSAQSSPSAQPSEPQVRRPEAKRPEQADARKRSPRALDEDLYGN